MNSGMSNGMGASQDAFVLSLNWHRPPINSVADYSFCKHTKQYFQQLAARRGIEWTQRKSGPAAEAMCASGYSNWNKFRRRVEEWRELQSPIPRKFADYLGARVDVLEAVMDFDVEDFEKALSLPLRPQYWTRRLMPAIYQSLLFPPSLVSEEDCIQYVRQNDFVVQGCKAWINYPGLKIVWVVDHKVLTHLYRPQLTLTRSHLVYAKDGREMGVMSIR